MLEIQALSADASSGGDSSGGLYRDLAKTSRKGCVPFCWKRFLELNQGRFPLEKVNRICDALRILLETRDAVKYVETILTTHVCKQPADYESGLQLLHRLQSERSCTYRHTLKLRELTIEGDHADIVEDAIKYIIFLSDVNKLYDVALGMYDFKLVLMVAQYSQKVCPAPLPRQSRTLKIRIPKNICPSCASSELLISMSSAFVSTTIWKDEAVLCGI